MTIFTYIKAVISGFISFIKDGGIMFAASISYFFMLAIVPFCLLLVAIFGYLLGENQELLGFLLGKIVSFFPRITYEITNEFKKLISYKVIGHFTLVLYCLLSYELFSSLESAMNVIFKIKGRRKFLISLILSIFVITLIILFIIISFGMTYIVSMLEALQPLFPDIHVGMIAGFIIKFVMPLTLLFLIAGSMYVILPNRKVKLKYAFSGALFTALFLEAAKHLFTFYVVKIARLGTIYGSLSAFVIFLLWIYYSFCILLIGAEIVHNLEGDRKA
ncbi:MAG: YihY/virulence factor BrkB family protein [Nitrospirae bacterium]|nr:YihY/virulence factor BrkB family protein [Nitrospirota bacterium]